MAITWCSPDDLRALFQGTVLSKEIPDDNDLAPYIENATRTGRGLLFAVPAVNKAAWVDPASTPPQIRQYIARLAGAEVISAVRGAVEWAQAWFDAATAAFARINFGAEILYDTDEVTVIGVSASRVKARLTRSDREFTKDTMTGL